MPGSLTTVLLVVARVAGLVTIAPGLQNRFVPWRIRIALIALLALPIATMLPVYSSTPTSSANLWMLLLQEAALGLSLGLAPTVLLYGLQLTAESLQGMTGLPVDSGPHTSGNSLSRLLFIFGLTVFFAGSGHRFVFEALLQSFLRQPVGQSFDVASTKDLFLELFRHSFYLGVQTMTPIAVALGISLLAIAALNRILPLFSYFAVGMSIQTCVLLSSLVILLGALGIGLETNMLALFDR